MGTLKRLLVDPYINMKVFWRRYIIAALLLFLGQGMVDVILWKLRGSFLGNVMYLGRYIPYAYFGAIAVTTGILFNNISRKTTNFFSSKNAARFFVVMGDPLIPAISVSISALLNFLLYAVGFGLAGAILLNVPPLALILATGIGFVVGLPFAMGVGILLATVGLFVRGQDFRAVYLFVQNFLHILLPVSYSIFPKNSWMLIIPTVSLIEGVRMCILGLDGLPLMAYTLFAGIALLLLARLLYYWGLNQSKKKGLILLE